MGSLGEKTKLPSQRKTLRRKLQQLPRYHSNCVVLTVRRPLQGPTTPLHLRSIRGEALTTGHCPRTLSSEAIGFGNRCRRLAPPAGSLEAPASIPLRHRFGPIIRGGGGLVNVSFQQRMPHPPPPSGTVLPEQGKLGGYLDSTMCTFRWSYVISTPA